MKMEDLKKGKAYKFSPLDPAYDPTSTLKTVVVTVVNTPKAFDDDHGGGVEVLVHSREWAEVGSGHSGWTGNHSIKGHWFLDSFGDEVPGYFVPLEGIPLLEEYE